MFENIPFERLLELNAQLQRRKNALRADLKSRGVLQKDRTNKFDNYTYFSEAGYKTLFTDLLSAHGLEMKFTELAYEMFDGTEKQSNGRKVTLRFTLIDCETGFYEDTDITAEGIDKGDKAGYKAYTGALKYYFADTFAVATGDDPETESPDEKMNNVKNETASQKQVDLLAKYYTGENLNKLLEANGVSSLAELPKAKASQLIDYIMKSKR